jgi:beta-lactamase superfamily II metal-dependent hydrolase
MLFTLETMNAKHGDALILHYGAADAPRTIVIDGGPAGVYNATLAPRLEELKASRAGDEDPLEIDILMVSHIDDDHVNGVIELMNDLADKVENEQPVPYEITTLWHNSFDDIVDSEAGDELKSLPAKVERSGAAAGPASVAVAASVDQGRTLRRLASKLSVKLNSPFTGLVSAADGPGPTVEFKGGLKFTIIAPSEGRLKRLNKEWDRVLRKRAAKDAEKAAKDAAYLDRSVFNLSSIVVIAEAGGKSILLTGDARGDDILKGLEAEGVLKKGGTVHFDVLKLPHHGSEHNVKTEFFGQVTADHYVISADGRDGNPEVATLQMISDARNDSDDFTVHLTNSEPRLVEFFKAEKGKGRKYRSAFRDPQALSMRIDLGSEPLAD